MTDSTLPFMMVAPSGARRGLADHPAIPVTPAATLATAAACHAAGADALHLHIRDQQGRHSLDTGLYREITKELSQTLPDMAVQVTTEAAGIFDVAAQLACLSDLRPAWASIAIREIARDPALAPEVYATCAANGTRVQHILFDADDIRLLEDWQASGQIDPEPAEVLLVLGRYTSNQTSSPDDLPPLVAALPEVGRWMVCAFGPQEHACLRLAANLGGDCRVGFENSYLQPDGQPWTDNTASVAALVETLRKDT